MLSTRNYLKYKLKDTCYYVNTKQKKARAVILISDKSDFKQGELSGLKRGIR